MDRKPEDEDRIRQLRERYKKNPGSDAEGDDDYDYDDAEGDGPDTPDGESDDDRRKRGCFMLFLKYSAVFMGFFGTIAILLWVMDAFVIPSYVHDKPIVQVPDLVGMPQDEAAELLAEIGLSWEKNGEQYDPQYKRGQVILQTPEAGLNVKTGRPIYLTISKGKEKAKVPYLIGMSSREAMIQLVSRGLMMGKISYENSEIFEPDIVLTQSIENGRELELGDTIHLSVSKGSELTILTPELVGLDIGTARQIIADNELLIGNIQYQRDETFNAGTVLFQYPTSGNETLKGTYIDMIVVGEPPPNLEGDRETGDRKAKDGSILDDLKKIWDGKK